MSHAPVGLAMAPGVHADEPKDLEGKVAGVVMIPSTRASFDTMLEAGGVDAGAVKVADPGFDLVAPLLAGKYDAVAVHRVRRARRGRGRRASSSTTWTSATGARPTSPS